jgi:uncharacterized protein (TIGR02246 family)
MRILVLRRLSGALLLSACVPVPNAASHDVTADSTAVRAASDAYVAAALANDAAAVSAFWTDDAVFMNAGMPTLRGRTSIDSLIQGMHSSVRVTELAVQIDELTVSGDAAYLLGTYNETLMPASGAPQRVSGRYLHVWRRQADGSWKLARAVGA